MICHPELVSESHHNDKTMNVGIIGSGTMGSGIAQVASTAGCQVKLYDTNQAALNKARCIFSNCDNFFPIRNGIN